MSEAITDKSTELKDRTKQKLIEISYNIPVSKSLGLYSGEMGKILFYAYLNLHFKKNKYIDKVEASLLNIFSEIKNYPINNTYCSGISGILWGIEHLKERHLIEIEGAFDFMVPKLRTSALKYAEKENFDFLHGSSGIIFYLLDTNAVNKDLINKWLKILHEQALKVDEKYIWKTLLDIETGEKVYNLGLSHGLSSTIIVLAEIVKKFPDNELANNLLNGSIEYLLSCKGTMTTESLFPSYVDEKPNNYVSSRMAWCYGDLGNAIALWRAGTLYKNENWKEEAIKILVHSSYRKDLEKNGLKDAGFCHGTSGVAHIFNRFYKETKLQEFDVARWYWLEKTLEMAKWDDGLAGYKMWSGKTGCQNESNLLEGSTGIGMVLLGFLSDDIKALSWDRCLMLS